MRSTTSRRARILRPLAAGLTAAALFSPLLTSAPAHAATSVACTSGDFRAVLPSGKVLTGYTGFKIAAKDVQPGSRVQIRGRYVEFDVDASTFATSNYTLTGASNPESLVAQRTPLFASKVPDLGGRTLDTGELEITFSPQTAVLRRRGSTVGMKIQAKDCATGGIFQMEPEAPTAIKVTHTLAPGIFYFKNPYTGKINFGNGDVMRGKDSPQVATRLVQTDTTTVWSVASGGRMGMVLGEDAVELSAGASPCVQQCQAQERIQGSLAVTDPFFIS